MNSVDIHRRTFLRYGLSGLGLLGLNSLMAEPQGTHGVVNPLHFPPKAKRVIYLFQSGAPSQLDLFDPKPPLERFRGQNLPDSVAPALTTPGMPRALVYVFDAGNLGTALGGTPLSILELFGDTPRALAATPDGASV